MVGCWDVLVNRAVGFEQLWSFSSAYGLQWVDKQGGRSVGNVVVQVQTTQLTGQPGVERRVCNVEHMKEVKV